MPYQVNVKGGVVASPIFTSPAKNSTRVTVPSLSVARAVSVMLAGETKTVPGAGSVSATVGGVLTRAPVASAIWIIGATKLLRGSVTGVPLACSAPRTSPTPAAGSAPFSTAHAPATCGVAIDVPLRYS